MDIDSPRHDDQPLFSRDRRSPARESYDRRSPRRDIYDRVSPRRGVEDRRGVFDRRSPHRDRERRDYDSREKAYDKLHYRHRERSRSRERYYDRHDSRRLSNERYNKYDSVNDRHGRRSPERVARGTSRDDEYRYHKSRTLLPVKTKKSNAGPIPGCEYIDPGSPGGSTISLDSKPDILDPPPPPGCEDIFLSGKPPESRVPGCEFIDPGSPGFDASDVRGSRELRSRGEDRNQRLRDLDSRGRRSREPRSRERKSRDRERRSREGRSKEWYKAKDKSPEWRRSRERSIDRLRERRTRDWARDRRSMSRVPDVIVDRDPIDDRRTLRREYRTASEERLLGRNLREDRIPPLLSVNVGSLRDGLPLRDDRRRSPPPLVREKEVFDRRNLNPEPEKVDRKYWEEYMDRLGYWRNYFDRMGYSRDRRIPEQFDPRGIGRPGVREKDQGPPGGKLYNFYPVQL